jgi:hypothetical protein
MIIEKIIQIFVSPKGNGFPVLIALIGAFSIYLGYDLFMAGVTEGGAALKVGLGKEKTFEMGKGGPGLVFSAFGMGIIIFSIWKFSSLKVQDERKVGIDKSGKRYEIDELTGEKEYVDQ